jgi:archaellum biogenesis protein FlaJ (TadC family)
MNDQSISAYVMAAAISLGFLLLAALVSSIIQYEGGSHPKDKRKRKTWFWILGILVPVVVFLVGFLFVRSGIKVPTMRDKYTVALSIATGASFVLYILLGFIMSKIFRNGKIGHWF